MLRLVLSALTLLSFACSTSACGYYLLGEDYRVAILNPYLVGDDYATFFYSSERFAHWATEKSGSDRLRNADAWAKELGNGLTGADVNRVLYGTNLQSWLRTIADPANGPLANEAAWKVISKKPDLLEYMLYAKGYETEAADVDYWGDPKTEDVDKSLYRLNFRKRAEAGYAKAKKGSFLKERYGYQLLLLAYYRDDAEAMETYFNAHFRDRQGPLADFARFHFARQWNQEGRYTVELANAFRVLPEKAFSIYQRTTGEFGEALDPTLYLSATKTDEEKSNLYALAAVQTPGYAVAHLRQAHAYDPSNPLLPLLIVREINKLEDWLMTGQLTWLRPSVLPNLEPYDYDKYESYDEYKQYRAEYVAGNYQKDRAHLRRLRSFLEGYRAKDTDLGKIFRAQAALLDEDFYRAQLFSRELSKKDGPVGLQARTIQYLAAVQDSALPLRTRTATAARLLPGLAAALPTDDETSRGHTAAALFRAASRQYAAAGDTTTAYLLHNRSLDLPTGDNFFSQYYGRIDYLDRKISDGTMQDMIDLMADPAGGDDLQRYLLRADQPDVNAVRDLAGTLALRRNDLATAERHFAAIPKGWHGANYAFAEYLDVSPLSDLSGKKISFPGKLAVVRQLRALEDNRRRGGATEAAACLQLGKAWFNMSAYGDAWMMLRYGTGHSWEEERARAWPMTDAYAAQEHNDHDFRVISRASRALEYLDCAEAAATDPEQAAEIALLRASVDVEVRQLSPYDGIYAKEMDSVRVAAYRQVMDGVVEKHRDTRAFEDFSAQCSTVRLLY